jgi:predicted TIM-barrel fold metal-dependent hydrolase
MLDLFDCNAILGKIKPRMPGGVLDAPRLLSEMDRYGIRESLFYHALAKRNDPARGNALASQAAAQSDRLHPCWVLLPPETGETPSLETLGQDMQAGRVRAVRIAPDAGNHLFSLARVVCGELFEWLARRRIPLFVELGPVSWESVDMLMETYAGLRLVLVDANYRVARDLYPRLRAYEGLYVETSGLQHHCGLQDVCERFGPHRLLFGSRLPVVCAGAAKHALEHAGISEEDKASIGGVNFRRLLEEVRWQ